MHHDLEIKELAIEGDRPVHVVDDVADADGGHEVSSGLSWFVCFLGTYLLRALRARLPAGQVSGWR
jgi:hypothetical protein